MEDEALLPNEDDSDSEETSIESRKTRIYTIPHLTRSRRGKRRGKRRNVRLRTPHDSLGKKRGAGLQGPSTYNIRTYSKYLGDDMNELSGRTLLEWEREIDLDILPLPGVVLIPGETLPLYLYQAHVKNQLSNSIN